MYSSNSIRRLTGVALAIVLYGHSAALAQNNPTPEADQHFAAQRWAEAAAAYEAITKKHPKDARAAAQMAISLHFAGEYEQAAAAFEKAAKFPAVRPVCLYNLGCARARLGEKDKAYEALESAIRFGFDDAGTLTKDADLASLHADPRWEKLTKAVSEAGDRYRAFDFWIGEWDVVNPQGVKVGTNTITSIENGAVILEKWDNGRGGTGTSINFVDPEDRMWKQVWVDQGGGVSRYSGDFTDGAMRFTGVATNRQGVQQLTRCTFTPLPDGKVRQFIEQSSDEGATWSVYFDGTYVPRKPAAASAGKATSAEQP